MSKELREAYVKFNEAMWGINTYVAQILSSHETLSRYSQQQMETLRIIKQNPKISQNEIAAIQGVFKTAISNRIKKLKEDGLIHITSDKDQRKKSVSLTQEGMQLLDLSEEVVYGKLNELFEDHFSKEEVIYFTKQLDEAAKLLKK
ncbi:MarR family winged helix-turn-helix transcriptional regulator [Halobacillus massiliensis]|uniref:MarR family winged helix-turn-helix transcriptional regulator n=1 Tax=Halobacillus massiliensis TaxID=1926286 RepID=UPI0009E47DCC|nr:SMC-Scp complex subunit ScpB [Halobacillus massiliensis]